MTARWSDDRTVTIGGTEIVLRADMARLATAQQIVNGDMVAVQLRLLNCDVVAVEKLFVNFAVEPELARTTWPKVSGLTGIKKVANTIQSVMLGMTEQELAEQEAAGQKKA